MDMRETVQVNIYKYNRVGELRLFMDNVAVTIDELFSFLKNPDKVIRYVDDNEIASRHNVLDRFVIGAPDCYISCDEFDSSGNVTKMTMHGFTEVPSNQFSDKPNLQTVDISKDNISVIGDKAFNGSGIKTVIFGDTLTSIGEGAFAGCGNLEITELPPGLLELKRDAFDECSKLNISSIPEGITNTGFGSLRKTGIVSMTFPKSLISVDHWTLAYCPNLKSVTFQSTLESISGNALAFCDNLTDVYVPWSEGEVEGAPWGASGATIHYDHVPN